MKHPEFRRQGEDDEAYVRRIANFQTLSYDTFQFTIFSSKNDHSSQLLEEWMILVFPESDWDSYDVYRDDVFSLDYLHPARISTKKFATWVIEEKIFDAWRSLGEEVSHSAELFVELVNGKKDTKEETILKPKANQARWAPRDKQREAARKVAKRLWKQDKTLTITDMGHHDEINKVAPNYSEKTLRDWVKDLALSNKPGRRPKK